MKVEKYKNLMVMILLIFVGQVVSAPITTCKINNHAESQGIMYVEVDSDVEYMHDMQTSQSGQYDNANMDCCEDDCDCPLGMCLTVVLYLNDNLEVLFSNSTNQVIPETPFVNNQSSSSIYRPPIFC